jgi:type IV secretion system protein VirD4
MRTQPQPNRTGEDYTIVVYIVGALAGLAGIHWLIGNLAALLGRRRLLHANLVDAVVALKQLPEHAGDPRLAWPEPAASNLPGPVVYWLATAVVLSAAVALVIFITQLVGRHRHEPPDKRRRLGVETQARLATTKELRPLLTRRPQPGRFVLTRWGRRYLATEAATYGRRRGVRGAVAIFGPSQSGKTTGLIAGVDAWHGPAVISSVKSDLIRATVEGRRQCGEVKVFDPLGVTGIASASWSPLRGATSLGGALAAAQVLARTGPDEAPSDRFWRGQAEQLIGAMLWTAANTEGHTMRHVVRWVLELDRPGSDSGGTLAPLVRLLVDHPDESVKLAAQQVQGWLHGQWSTDPRTTSSVYATARNAVWPWADPTIAASADSCDITIDWLLAGEGNTLYLSAPLGDETRIGVVFAVLLHDLITQAFDRYNRVGEPLDPRLLVLLDEAANTPLPKLPQWASTVTGAGIQLVTVWQSKAQLDQTYHQDADTVLTNHRSKLIYPSGLSDLSTVQYVSELVGDEHVRNDLDDRRGWQADVDRSSGRSPATALPFLPASTLRRAQVGDALLVHGHLPPAWIQNHRRPTWMSRR